jgi:TPR repeat protein
VGVQFLFDRSTIACTIDRNLKFKFGQIFNFLVFSIITVDKNNMSQFISTVEIHGAPDVTPKEDEIDALCSLLSNLTTNTNQLRQAILNTIRNNDVETLYKLGTLHQFGLHGLIKCHSKAMSYYEYSVSKDHLPSINALASLYADMFDQTSIKEYYQNAVKYFTLAMNQGNVDAIYNLGCLAASNRNQKEALRFWHLGFSKHSHGPSLSALCDYYWAAKKYEIVVPLLHKASKLGDSYSKILLANCYVQGLGVKEIHYESAIRLLTPLALDQDESKEIIIAAASNLGQVYMSIADFNNALTYHTIAANENHQPSIDSVGRLKRMNNVIKHEKEQNTMKNKETAVLLGARKASGFRCSNCKKYGYVEKSWVYCKCRKTKTCCLHCQEIFFPIHIKDCRKNLKELEDSKKRNSGNHRMKKEKNNDGTNCARDLKSTNTVVPSSFVNAI